jgi:hypothetical protein
MRRICLSCSLIALAGAACAKAPPSGPAPSVIHDTVVVQPAVGRVDTVADPDTRQRLSEMEAEVLSREARIQILEEQLEDAQREVVRAMARSQTVASRAEAASAIAEAELAVNTLRSQVGPDPGKELPSAERYLRQSNEAFNAGNYGGALYLASQTRATTGRVLDRIRRQQASDTRPGETAFDAPLRLQTTTRANVRDGPGLEFRVLFTLDPGSSVQGVSYIEGWVRITDDSGRTGWIARSLVDSRN